MLVKREVTSYNNMKEGMDLKKLRTHGQYNMNVWLFFILNFKHLKLPS